MAHLSNPPDNLPRWFLRVWSRKDYWLVVELPTPLKNMKVSQLDDEIPNWMEIQEIHVPNHQPDYDLFSIPISFNAYDSSP